MFFINRLFQLIASLLNLEPRVGDHEEQVSYLEIFEQP